MRSFIVGCGTGQSVGPAGSSWGGFGNSGVSSNSGETISATKLRTPGKASYIGVFVDANGITGASTFKLRKNGADSGVSASVTGSTTGLFMDTTNSVTVVEGDTLQFNMLGGSGGTSLTYWAWSATFETVVGALSIFWAGRNASFSTASSTNYMSFSTTGFYTGTESGELIRMREDGTLKNLHVIVNSNGRTTTTTIGVRKNSANGNLVVSIGSSATGSFEDTTNSDRFTSGDLCCFYITTGTGTGTIAPTHQKVEAINLRKCQTMIATRAAVPGANTTNYIALGQLGATLTTTEANTQAQIGFECFARYLQINVTANTVSATSTFRTRKNGANGNLAASITSSTTGRFEDVTGVDSYVLGDKVNYQIVTGATGTNLTMDHLSMVLIDKPAINSVDRRLRPRVLAPGRAR